VVNWGAPAEKVKALPSWGRCNFMLYVLSFVEVLYVKGIILQVSQLTWFNTLTFLFGEESMWKRKSWMHNSWQTGDLLIRGSTTIMKWMGDGFYKLISFRSAWYCVCNCVLSNFKFFFLLKLSAVCTFWIVLMCWCQKWFLKNKKNHWHVFRHKKLFEKQPQPHCQTRS